jgi:3-phosphoshikimate 1-carboxyvinyltransferase
VLKGVNRLRHKESDRSAALLREFGKLGCRIRVQGDEMQITGGRLEGGATDSHGDHRIAMAAAVAALTATDKIHIAGAECVSKSYADFFDDLAALGVETS